MLLTIYQFLGSKIYHFSGERKTIYLRKKEIQRLFRIYIFRSISLQTKQTVTPHCPQGLFSPFFTFLRATFFRPFRLSLVPTLCPWVSEDGDHFDFFDLFFNFFEEERIIILASPGFEPTHLCDPSDQRGLQVEGLADCATATQGSWAYEKLL